MPAVAWGAVAGMFMSTITGYLLKYPAEKGLEGLWGFNGILVGCALPTFLGNVPLMWLAIVIFSAMTTWVMVGLNYLLAPYKVSSFTFPFVLITWFVLMAARIMHGCLIRVWVLLNCQVISLPGLIPVLRVWLFIG